MISFVIIAFIVLFDQLTKIWAASFLQGRDSLVLLKGVFQFTYLENRGAAWGMLADSRWVFMLLSTVAILFMIAYLIYTRKNRPILLTLSLCMFIGGGIGNMIDRVRLGYVVDFLDFNLIHFPIFNVADSFITVGAVLIILYLVLDLIREHKKKTPSTNSSVSDEKNSNE